MDIKDLTKEELKYIIDNIEKIKSEYSNKYGVYEDDVYFKHESNKSYEYDAYVVAVVTGVDGETVEFAEFDISNNNVVLFNDLSLDKDEFLEEFTKVDMKLQFELLKLYDSKKENISNIEKTYYLKAKDLLQEYKLI
jgi:hypothetical protein